MEIETESEQTNKRILNVGGENVKESERTKQFMIEASGDEGEDNLWRDDASTAEDLYNFDVSVAVTEIQSDEIDAEFAEAIQEIDGERVFPCSQCEKVCKSKGGLTRHTRSKHPEDKQDKTHAALTKEAVVSIVQSIKVKLREENFYGTEIMNSLATVSSTDALFDALGPLYTTFCRKNSQDKLLECFYGLIPRSCELLNCENYKAANLVMIHIPEHLVGFYNTSSPANEESSSKAIQHDPVERGPLSYVAGYVISKLFQFNKKSKQGNHSNQGLKTLLQAMKSNETNNFISARTRGGLVTPCSDLVGILEVAEMSFRENVVGNIRHIPVEKVCDATLKSPTAKSLWENIVFSCEVQPSNSTQKLCLENIVKLYLRVRAFSYTRDFITKYRINERQSKKKALRKDMKQGDMFKT